MKRISESEAKYYRKLDSKIDLVYNMRQAIAFTLTPAGDGGEFVTYYGESWIDPTKSIHKPYFIYVLVNPGLPGICKIGYTKKTVYDRCREINSSTGVITPWYPVFTYKCPNGPLLEKEIHKNLESFGKRVNLRREGFQIESSEAIKLIEKLGKKYQNT
jgi:hypothetical protein